MVGKKVGMGGKKKGIVEMIVRRNRNWGKEEKWRTKRRKEKRREGKMWLGGEKLDKTGKERNREGLERDEKEGGWCTVDSKSVPIPSHLAYSPDCHSLILPLHLSHANIPFYIDSFIKIPGTRAAFLRSENEYRKLPIRKSGNNFYSC